MQAIGSSKSIFDVKFLENDGNKLANLIPDLQEHQDTISQAQPYNYSNNKNLFKLFQTSLMEVLKIQNIIKDRIIDIHYKTGLADKYKIIVAYDSTYKIPQAIGILKLEQENLKGEKSIELYSIITAFRNLNCPQNIHAPYRVKGAGSSIIQFCKEIGKQQKAKYLYLEAASCALGFYEKLGFKKVNLEAAAEGFGEDDFGIARTPMVLDLEAS